MPQEAIEKCKACGISYNNPAYVIAYKDYVNFEKSHPELHNQIYNTIDFNKGPQYDELYSAYRDLADANDTLTKYETALNKQTNFKKMDKIKPIWDFLQN